VSELDQARDYLHRRADVDRRRLALIGLGTGGHYVFEWCARNVSASAAVCVNAPYLADGPPGAAFDEASLRAPFSMVELLRVPLLALYGEKDPSVPAGFAEKFGQALERHRKPFHLKTFADAGRDLLDPAGPGCDAKSADEAWAMIAKFLGEQLERGKTARTS
jgi:dienelactone hydrolase